MPQMSAKRSRSPSASTYVSGVLSISLSIALKLFDSWRTSTAMCHSWSASSDASVVRAPDTFAIVRSSPSSSSPSTAADDRCNETVSATLPAARSSKNPTMRSRLRSMKRFIGSMAGSFLPNDTPFARFCRTFETSVSARCDLPCGCVLDSLKKTGEKIAGHKKRKNKKPAATLWYEPRKYSSDASLDSSKKVNTSRGNLADAAIIDCNTASHTASSRATFAATSSPASTFAGSTSNPPGLSMICAT
mmetsp:Transcript_15336/g.47908  ORF Transcript_15336/g.47908 Transcript_15336/m.47908 type:complete len:247 (-) Transcript_15336:828-1568(-)